MENRTDWFGRFYAQPFERRLDTAKRALKDMGGEFKPFFFTMGDYDMVAISKLRTTLWQRVSTCSWACWETSGRAR